MSVHAGRASAGPQCHLSRNGSGKVARRAAGGRSRSGDRRPVQDGSTASGRSSATFRCRCRRARRWRLVGANGAGKSTLLRCCLRLIEPDAGAHPPAGARRARSQPPRAAAVAGRGRLRVPAPQSGGAAVGAEQRAARRPGAPWRPDGVVSLAGAASACAKRRCIAWSWSASPISPRSAPTGCPAASRSGSRSPAP